jgi:hypothetical protein
MEQPHDRDPTSASGGFIRFGRKCCAIPFIVRLDCPAVSRLDLPTLTQVGCSQCRRFQFVAVAVLPHYQAVEVVSKQHNAYFDLLGPGKFDFHVHVAYSVLTLRVVFNCSVMVLSLPAFHADAELSTFLQQAVTKYL